MLPNYEMIIMEPTPALRVKRVHENAKLPTKAHMSDLGFDLYALEDVTLNPGVVTKVRTGIHCGFPPGYGALIRDRSGVATKKEVFVVAGVIDEGYTGEIIVAFYNPGHLEVSKTMHFDSHTVIGRDTVLPSYVTHVANVGFERFQAGDKIAQMILIPVVNFPISEVDELVDTTSRGESGFGSSGQ